MTAPTYLLALDQGTSSSRAIVFNDQGHIVSLAQQEFPQIYPQPGWVEHDPLAIWHSQRDTAQKALAQCQLNAADIRAVGITNQRETTVLWHRQTGVPLHNAIVWQDRRTEALCQQWREQGAEPLVQQRTGLRLDPYFSATKLRWLLDHIPGARAQAQAGELAFGTVDTWLIWQLTSGKRHVTDISNASRTLLLNIHTGQWDDELLALFDIPRAVLPEVLPSVADFGQLQSGLLGRAGPGYRRRGGRPAIGPARASLFAGRRGQEHLWHRLFHAHAHGPHGPAQHQRPHHYLRHATAAFGIARIRAGRQRLHGRSGGAMAARWPQSHPAQQRGGGPGC